MPSSQKLSGILRRKVRWGLSWRGWLVVALLVLLTGRVLFLNIYPFLAVTHRLDARILVVEGWVPDGVIRAGIEEFKTGSYECVFSTGGPVKWSGGYTSDDDTTAIWGSGRLTRGGIRRELVQMVPARVVDRDRTYSSALALRDWFQDHHLSVHGINIVTEDVHARRTRLLFQEALGRDVTVGIIAVPNPDYDSAHWWRYSEGVRDVLGEAIAYVYAKFLFYPSAHGIGGETHAAGHE
jgi:uncharacterized SAM-binding protein YcdF (DUF218 family)